MFEGYHINNKTLYFYSFKYNIKLDFIYLSYFKYYYFMH